MRKATVVPCICRFLFIEWAMHWIGIETWELEEFHRVRDGHYASCNSAGPPAP